MREAREALEVIEAYLKTWSPISSSHKYHAQDILAALSSAGLDCEGWRTIESAPKDGARFLGVTLNDVVVLVWWDESEHQGKAAWTDGTVESWGYEEVHTFKLKAWRPLPPLASGGG